jgi:hypothetical protein
MKPMKSTMSPSYLIAELDQMDGSEEHWEAKFTVLSENIKAPYQGRRR